METKLTDTDPKAKFILSCGPLSNSFMISCTVSDKNRSGGLALIWNNDVLFNILNGNKMMIDLYITSCNSPNHWYATGIYGSPYNNSKYQICDAINDLYASRKNDS